jgi:arylsulfatase
MKAMGVDVFIDLRNKSYRMTADVVLEAAGQGALVCQGGQFGGLSLYMKDGKPSFTYNFLGLESSTIESTRPLPPGKHTLVCDFIYEGGGPGKGGTLTISANGEVIAKGRLNRTQPGIFSVDDLADIGADLGTPVTDYGGPSQFNGKIEKILIETR